MLPKEQIFINILHEVMTGFSLENGGAARSVSHSCGPIVYFREGYAWCIACLGAFRCPNEICNI